MTFQQSQTSETSSRAAACQLTGVGRVFTSGNVFTDSLQTNVGKKEEKISNVPVHLIKKTAVPPRNTGPAAVIQTKCPACEIEEKLPRKAQISARPSINQPNDSYEHEADLVSDRVMQMKSATIQTKPFLISSLQRKCAHCEEEERKLQRKELNDGHAAVPDQLESYVSGLDRGGQPMSMEDRNFFEPRFGYDFSNVRLHTGSLASESAGSINALAYTNGSNIVFNEGQYSQSDDGRRLLAHELTHVVQQGGGIKTRVQRLSPGDASFEISGLPADSAERPNFVFFNRDSTDIPDQEMPKLKEFAKQNQENPVINLYGYASEEGVDSENDALISQRLANVQSSLSATINTNLNGPYAGIINTIPRRQAASHQINYRMFRSVEMSTGATSLSGGNSGVRTRNCVQNEHNNITTAQTSAITQIQSAIQDLQSFRQAPNDHPEVVAVLDNNFHSHSNSTTTTLLQHLRQVQSDLANLTGDGKRQCASDQFSDCLGADALTSRPVVTFCPNFFQNDTPETRVETLSHEMCHYALFSAHDRAYRSERVLRFLSTNEALDNAESIAIFITEINSPDGTRVSSTLTEPSSDTITGCGSNQTMVEEALAWAERWNTYAFFGMSQTYSNWENFVQMAPHITRRLGPVNRFTLAGIFDRYSSLSGLFSAEFRFECPTTGANPCSTPVFLDPSANSFTVCPSFFTDTLHNRIVLLYAEVTKKVPEIKDDQRIGYAELARDYKSHFWGLPPT